MRRVGSDDKRPYENPGPDAKTGKRQKKSAAAAKVSPETAERNLVADLQKAQKGPAWGAALHRWGKACAPEDNKMRHAQGLAVVLKETAERINNNPRNGRAMLVSAEHFRNWFSQIGHDPPAMLVEDAAFDIDPARAMYQAGDTYSGFGTPRGALVEHVFKDSAQDKSVAYPDPTVFAWLLKRFERDPAARRAVTFEREEVLNTDLVTPAANAQAQAFEAFLQAAGGPVAAKIVASVERLQASAANPSLAKKDVDQLIKRLCKSFVDFTVAQGCTVHISSARIEWTDATKEVRNGEHRRFTYAELRRLAKNPHATRTAFYDGITPIDPPGAFIQYKAKLKKS